VSGAPARFATNANLIGISVALALLVAFVFGQTAAHTFVNFDDDVYVYDNAWVSRGVTAEGVGRAFTAVHASNWHPLTTLSHLLDCQFFGLKPGGHHITNVVLHAAAAMSLFFALRALTGALWRSAFVAALFAVHPLRVESVAWVAERKDVLSGLFFALTLWSYARFVQQPKSRVRHALVILAFALGLLCKPMLVTLPFVLLLLDYWPLRRFGVVAATPSSPHIQISGATRPARLVVEKLPLFALAAAAAMTTLVVQGKVMQAVESFPLALRADNAFVSTAIYVGQFFWPANLAVFYPYPTDGIAVWKTLLALLVLGGVSITAFRWRRQQPFILTGWLWFLGMLVPVIGLIQVGVQARADRYTYLPQIGLAIAVVWGLAELAVRRPRFRPALLPAGAAALIACAFAARGQIAYWRNSETLWGRALAVTSRNAIAHSNFGNVLFRQGRRDESISHFRQALEIEPAFPDAQNGLGFALMQQDQLTEAMAHFEHALKTKPDGAAIHNNFGMALLQANRIPEAVEHFNRAVTLEPGLVEAHNNYGYALLRSGKPEAAIAQYQMALILKPDYAGPANNLAWVLATSPRAELRNGPRAVEMAERANRLSEASNLVMLRTLAAAYAEAGRFNDAIAVAQRTAEIAAAQRNIAMVKRLQQEIAQFRNGQPLRDTE
jgi:protein O-mannosyl-transferase